MPELPEVETMCRGLQSICGRELTQLRSLPCRAKPLAITPSLRAIGRRARSRRLDRVARIGKRVVFEFDGGGRLVFEPRMTGLVLLSDPPTRDHLRVEMRFAGSPGCRVWIWDRRGLGTLRWYSHSEWLGWLEQKRLGPDALEVSRDDLTVHVGSTRSAIKVALMDQRRIAGIGNLYASEILHRAGIDPRRRADELTPRDWSRLRRALRKVLLDAIRYEGSTLGDGTYRNALNQPGGYQNHHAVYGKVGCRCSRCRRGTIQRIVQQQRATFFCPVCQA